MSRRATLASALLVLAVAAAPAAARQRKPRPIPHPTPMTVVQGFGTAVVSRVSAAGDAGTAPFKSVSIQNVFTAGWKTGPKVGAEMTVIPLGVDVAPISLKIAKAQFVPNPCDKARLPWTWEIALEEVSSRAFFDAKALAGRSQEFPFDVAVVYPANAGARAVPTSRLTAAMLPKGVSPGVVHAAIDLDGDGAPELLETRFCCGQPSTPAGDTCDHTCGKVYERAGGAWRLRGSNDPC